MGGVSFNYSDNIDDLFKGVQWGDGAVKPWICLYKRGKSNTSVFTYNQLLSQVIPMVTIMMHSLDRSENDHGVIGWKAKLKESINQRLGGIEFEEQYSVATLLIRSLYWLMVPTIIFISMYI